MVKIFIASLLVSAVLGAPTNPAEFGSAERLDSRLSSLAQKVQGHHSHKTNEKRVQELENKVHELVNQKKVKELEKRVDELVNQKKVKELEKRVDELVKR